MTTPGIPTPSSYTVPGMDALLAQPPAPQQDAQPNATDQSQAPGLNTLQNPGQGSVPGGASIQDILQAKGAFSPALGKFVSGMNATAAADPNPAKPGAWARAAVGAVPALLGGGNDDTPPPTTKQKIMGGVNQVTGALGDAAAVGTVPKGGGALTGIARTLNARGERLSKEQSDLALRAETNARTTMIMKNIYRQDQQDRQASYALGAKRMDAMLDNYNVEENVSQKDIDSRIRQNPNYWETHTGTAVGEEPVLDGNGKPMVDKKGQPVMTPIYDVADLNPKSGTGGGVKVDAKDAEFFKRNGVNVPEGTEMNATRYNHLYVKAHGVEDARAAIDKANQSKMASDKFAQMQTNFEDPTIQHLIAANPLPQVGLSNGKKDIEGKMAAIDQQIQKLTPQDGSQPNPQVAQQLQALQQQRQPLADLDGKIDDLLTNGFDDKAKDRYEKFLDKHTDEVSGLQKKLDGASNPNAVAGIVNQAKGMLQNAPADQRDALQKVITDGTNIQKGMENQADAEDTRKRTLKEKEDEDKLKSESAQGDTSKRGEDYIKTLPTGHQDMVRRILRGEQGVGANRKEALQLLEEASHADPDHFDEEKYKKWQKTDNEYTGSGKNAQFLVRANTALKHAKELYDTLNFEGIFNPVSKAYQDRKIAAGRLSDEIGAAIKTGVVNQEEGKKMFEDINGGVTVENKKERVRKVTQLLYDKIEAAQDAYNDAAPSSYVDVKHLLKPRGQAAYDYVQTDGKKNNRALLDTGASAEEAPAPATQGTAASGQKPPEGATHQVLGPDQKMHYTNAAGTVDYGVVPQH